MDFDFHALSAHLERVYSSRISIRPVALSDSWPLFAATRNPLFNEHLLWPQPSCEEQVLDRVQAIVDASRSGRMTAISACVRQTGEFFSLFRFQPHSTRRDVLEMGIWTHDRFWHGSYSLELGRICVGAAFSLSNVHTLLGAAAPSNRPSCILMSRVGLQPGALVERMTEDGRKLPLREFTIDRSRWDSLGHQSLFNVYRHSIRALASQTPEAEAVR